MNEGNGWKWRLSKSSEVCRWERNQKLSIRWIGSRKDYLGGSNSIVTEGEITTVTNIAYAGGSPGSHQKGME